MIDMSKSLRWALILFSVTTGISGKETASASHPSFYATQAACNQEGERLLSVIDVEEGVRVQFACIPRSVLD